MSQPRYREFDNLLTYQRPPAQQGDAYRRRQHEKAKQAAAEEKEGMWERRCKDAYALAEDEATRAEKNITRFYCALTAAFCFGLAFVGFMAAWACRLML